MDFEADMAVFFDPGEGAVEARWTPRSGGQEQTVYVDFRSMDEELQIGSAGTIGRRYLIVYPASRLTGLCRGESLAVGGVNYFVREEPRAIDDGALMEAMLGVYDT